MKSLSEIETTVKRASKAAGYSWGVSEETGKSIRLLELFSLPGIKHLNEYFNEKNKSKFVAVLVKPENEILDKIKNLPFDYYQLYDCSPEEIKKIKEKYNRKIITAFTIKEKKDVNKYKLFCSCVLINTFTIYKWKFCILVSFKIIFF